jgi:hypothetical protein
MRTIKFRQPFYKKGKFAGFTYWGFVDSGFAGITTGTNATIQQAQEQSEQFIGLCDKNGKEIYEGDIVKQGNGVIAKIIFSRGELGLNGWACEWLTGAFVGGRGQLWYTVLDAIGGLEVIGNIHKNPELLENVK